MIAAIILAAGRGARLGGVAKALLPAGEESFLAAIARIAAAAGVSRSLVVVGPPFAEAVSAEATRLGLEIAVNPDPDRGMGSSVAIGFAAARGAEVGLLWPVDVARVAVATVARVVADAGPERIVVPTWGGRGGHPAGFGRALFDELAGCADLPEGARSVVHRDPARVLHLPTGDPGVLADVDVPADLP